MTGKLTATRVEDGEPLVVSSGQDAELRIQGMLKNAETREQLCDRVEAALAKGPTPGPRSKHKLHADFGPETFDQWDFWVVDGIDFDNEADAELWETLDPDAVRRLVADSRRLAEVEQAWRPIETAPKDGTVLLLYQPNDVILGSWNAGSKYFPDCWRDNGEGFELDPTHWMPRPVPPSARPAPEE